MFGQFYCCAGYCHHEHSVTDGFIIEVYPHDGICAKGSCLHLHFCHSSRFGFSQYLLVGRRSATDDICDTGKKVFENVGADDGFTGNYS